LAAPVCIQQQNVISIANAVVDEFEIRRNLELKNEDYNSSK
jgi:hypothetical protein